MIIGLTLVQQCKSCWTQAEGSPFLLAFSSSPTAARAKGRRSIWSPRTQQIESRWQKYRSTCRSTCKCGTTCTYVTCTYVRRSTVYEWVVFTGNFSWAGQTQCKYCIQFVHVGFIYWMRPSRFAPLMGNVARSSFGYFRSVTVLSSVSLTPLRVSQDSNPQVV